MRKEINGFVEVVEVAIEVVEIAVIVAEPVIVAKQVEITVVKSVEI